MELRSGLRYKNLGHHLFTVTEKQWVCRHLTGCEGNFVHIVADFVGLYHIDYEIVETWIRLYLAGNQLEAGRAAIVYPCDRIGLLNIMKFYRVGQMELETEEEYRDRAIKLMKFEMSNTERRRYVRYG